MNDETEASILAAVLAEVEELQPYQCDLVYVDYRDGLTDEQVNMLVGGDVEGLEASTDEWIDENRFGSACHLLEEILSELAEEWDEEVLDDWKLTGSFDEARYAIEDRDTSEPLKQLAHQTGQVMLRITAVDEDDCWSFEPVEVEELLSRIGLEATDTNRKVAGEIIANASPEFSVCLGFWLASVDVGDLYDLLWCKDPQRLEITNPGFWLGSPFTGAGWADQLEGTITVAREDLRTDKGAFGYGWQEVCGCNPRDFPVTIKEAS